MERLFNWIAYKPQRGISGGIIHLLLTPLQLLSFIYCISSKTRLILYRLGFNKSLGIGCKVISIGNITVGGTGKTPTVQFIARSLQKEGFKVGILSRGYGAESPSGINVVSDGENVLMTPDEGGDEPFMLAQKLPGIPVVTGPERLKTGAFMTETFSPDVILLDDAFQHIKIKRDLNILLVDAVRGFGNGYLLPRGPLREPLSGIKRADIVILTKSADNNQQLADQISRINPEAKLFKSKYQGGKLVSIFNGEELSLEALKSSRVTAFSGIADPHSFLSSLSRHGAEIVSSFSFKDHHNYSDRDINLLYKAARDSGSTMIVTTEKDAVKLVKLRGLPSNIEIYFLEITLAMGLMEFEFTSTLKKVLDK